LIQAIIDLQDKIQLEGTITGREFNTQSRQDRNGANRSAGVVQVDSARSPMA